jgi:hypothetical protein
MSLRAQVLSVVFLMPVFLIDDSPEMATLIVANSR